MNSAERAATMIKPMRRPIIAVLLAVVPAILPTGLEGQRSPAATPAVFSDGRRPQATRAELEATVAEVEKVIASPGYSARLRESRRLEAALIRERLSEGDLQVGDLIDLQVLGETQFSGKFIIGAGQMLSLPGMPDIPMRGVLRSEAQGYLTEQLRRQLRDPRVQVQTNIRLTITGAVSTPGFYQVPADIMASDAIMAAAGGIASGGDPNRTIIRRQGREIWSREAFQDAMLRGMTLDHLNLRAGDEIIVGGRGSAPFQMILAGLGAVSSITYLLVNVF